VHMCKDFGVVGSNNSWSVLLCIFMDRLVYKKTKQVPKINDLQRLQLAQLT
jgi:hypothetical protein